MNRAGLSEFVNLLAMIEMLPDGDERKEFYTWVRANFNHLEEACQDLGVEMSQCKTWGDLRRAVMPKLQESTRDS